MLSRAGLILRLRPPDLLLIGRAFASLSAENSGNFERVSVAQIRSKFAHSELPEQYATIPVVYASYRSDTGLPLGTWASRKLRVHGFVTGSLDSLPHRQADRPLIYPANEISSIFRKWGARFQNQICMLEIIALDELSQLMQPEAARAALFQTGWTPTALETFQVLPRRLQLSPVHRDLLNVTMMNCPDSRIVHCKVPVTPVNADESPCVKRGGWPLVTKKFITVRSAATNIPLIAPVDCSVLDSDDKVRVGDLQLAQGQYIVGLNDDVAVLSMQGGKKARSKE